VIDKNGSTLAYVASGCVKTDADGSLPQRIATILDGSRRNHRHLPAAAGGGGNRLRQRQSAIHAAARPGARRGDRRAGNGKLPVAEYTALQVKQAVVGHGKAAKEQVQAMVARLLKLPGEPTADAADALACAIAHAHGGQGLGAWRPWASACAAGASSDGLDSLCLGIRRQPRPHWRLHADRRALRERRA
jgi:crossover junction endodeoxyribonuclease RuvC